MRGPASAAGAGRNRQARRLGRPSAALFGHHRRPPGDGVEGRGEGEEGETLVEVLMTTVLMGLAIVAILTTLMTLIVSAHSHRRRVRAGNEAVAVVEAIENATYVGCAGSGVYAPAIDQALRIGASPGTDDPQRGNYEITIDSIEYLQDRSAATPTFGASCPGTDQGLQRITVKVVSPHQTRVTEELSFVKRDTSGDCTTCGGEGDGGTP